MSGTRFKDDFRRNFLTGIAALFPIVVTLVLFGWLYGNIDRTIGQGANDICRNVLAHDENLFSFFFPGATDAQQASPKARADYVSQHFPRFIGVSVGLIGLAVLVYLLGKFLRGYIGNKLMQLVDRIFTRFPLIKSVYPHARQVGDFIFGQKGRHGFRDVVLIQYPRRGIYSIGFLTGNAMEKVREKVGSDLVTVFVPTSPTPLTGFAVQVAPDEVVSVDMSVDEAFRFFITAGMLSGEQTDLKKLADPGPPQRTGQGD
ncbi:MAG: DUF502 domain-containing protein [Planctomycetes bacterium]|nr:DUF502 domain-containing protein [Planctomycetota bacterium]